MSAFVYMVVCRDGSLYTGWTTDVDKRVATHNAGKGSKYCRSRLPVKLAFHQEFLNKRAAMAAEWAIKQLSRAQKLALASHTLRLDAIT